MKNKKIFSLKHVIIILFCVIIGLVLIASGNNFLSNVGAVLLVSGVYTVVDNMYLKESLIELVIEKVSLDKDIESKGLVKIGATLTEIDYKNLFENAKSNIDIVHNYARTWTTNNYDFIKKTVLNSECKIRVVLLNPDSPFIPALEKHYGYSEGHLVELINEVSERWKGLAKEVAEKRAACTLKKSSSYKNKKCGEVELFYFNGQPTNSFYRIDDKIIVVNSKSSKEKSVYLPYSIYKENGETGLYSVYLKEIETIIDEATVAN